MVCLCCCSVSHGVSVLLQCESWCVCAAAVRVMVRLCCCSVSHSMHMFLCCQVTIQHLRERLRRALGEVAATPVPSAAPGHAQPAQPALPLPPMPAPVAAPAAQAYAPIQPPQPTPVPTAPPQYYQQVSVSHTQAQGSAELCAYSVLLIACGKTPPPSDIPGIIQQSPISPC